MPAARWTTGSFPASAAAASIALCNSCEPLPAGTKIAFSLHLDTQDVPLTGIVRRSMPGEGMAILFTDLSAEAKRRIKIQIAGLVAAPDGAPKR